MGMEKNSKLHVKESYIDATRGFYCGSHIMDTDFDEDEIGDLFRYLRREFGRCISKVYAENITAGETSQIGWVFQKRVAYIDCDDTYLREVWIVVLRRVPQPNTAFRSAAQYQVVSL